MRVTAATVEASPEERRDAAARVDPEDLAILRLAAGRIERFHERQRQEGWEIADEEGVELGQRILPLSRVGIYAPGGLACYPSTVLMTAIPARIAGVGEIILVTPSRDGRLQPLIAAAAELGGRDPDLQDRRRPGDRGPGLRHGVDSPVDKIVGPGNAYVAAAKKMVFGRVAIDMIAGPSEVLIIADGTGEAAFAAADLLAQAEHDETASAILLTPDEAFARAVAAEVDASACGSAAEGDRLPVAGGLRGRGRDAGSRRGGRPGQPFRAGAPRTDGAESPASSCTEISNAGAVFLGMYTPEALGDYMAGPNHVLPTGGTARFASPLGVYDFVKRTSILSFSREALERYGTADGAFCRDRRGSTDMASRSLIQAGCKKILTKWPLLIKMGLRFRWRQTGRRFCRAGVIQR